MGFPLKMSKTSLFYTTEISKNNITTKNIYEKEAERLLKNKDGKSFHMMFIKIDLCCGFYQVLLL